MNAGHPAAATAYALATVLVWSSLAPLGVSVNHLPPFFITGCSLLVGGALALPSLLRSGQWRIDAITLAIGIYGLFGYHVLLFTALQWAPPVAANLLNYLWPMGIVVLAPLFVRQLRFTWGHALAALLGFAGSAWVILDQAKDLQGLTQAQAFWGYLSALAAAITWSTYSLMTKRRSHVPTPTIGAICLVCGALSLGVHAAVEPAVSINGRDAMVLFLLGLGPVGGAFYIWDKALKLGDARQVGLWAFLTPVLSTALLSWQSGQPLRLAILGATTLIVVSALVGRRAASAPVT